MDFFYIVTTIVHTDGKNEDFVKGHNYIENSSVCYYTHEEAIKAFAEEEMFVAKAECDSEDIDDIYSWLLLHRDCYLISDDKSNMSSDISYPHNTAGVTIYYKIVMECFPIRREKKA